MINPNKKIPLSRRGFMARSACSAMGISGIVNTIAHLRLMEGALATNVTTIDDYKALVVLFHFGATDANNMLMPGSGHPSRANYDANRGVLALPLASPGGTDDPHAITAANLAADTNAPVGAENFALHPRLPDLQTLFNDGDLAFAANVGTLVVPTTKTEYQNGTVPLPPQLFSHSDQQNQWQSSVSDAPFQSGWQGRIADFLNVENTSGQISMAVSLSGINDIQIGLTAEAPQYSVTNNGAITLSGYGTNYANALSNSSDPTSYASTNSNARRLKSYQDIMNYTHDHLFEEGYNQVVRRARENEGFTGSAIGEANAWLSTTNDSQGNPWPQIELNFLLQAGLDPSTINQSGNNPLGGLSSLSRQLLMIAKLITGRRCLGNKRQLFFCSYGGHDTHQDQGGFGGGSYVRGDLDDNMEFLNDALKAFSDTMHQLETYEAGFTGPPTDAFTYNDFLLASHSDFNRTFTPNGNNAGPSGSDHAYATNVYMMGGDVKGGNVYGYYPDLAPTGNWGTPGSSRGRWIPTSAIEQFSAPLGKWMGLTDLQLSTVFPNLERFADPLTTGYDPGTGLDDYGAMLGAANMNYITGVGLP